jgi:hypothetical protein
LGGLEIVTLIGLLLLSSESVGDGSLILCEIVSIYSFYLSVLDSLTRVEVVVRVLLALVVGIGLLGLALGFRDVSLVASLVDATVTNVGVARHDECLKGVVFFVGGKDVECEMRCSVYERSFESTARPFCSSHFRR